MKLFWIQSRRLRIIYLVVFTAVVVFFASCVFFRFSSLNDLTAYLGMATECHPIWKQFALHRFQAGDSATELLKKFPPDRSKEFGRYGVYSYFQNPNGLQFTGLTVTTRDGKLLTASTASCTWSFSFFHISDTNIDVEYSAYMKAFHKKAEQQRLAKLGTELKKFFFQQNRWPTNELEFSCFVSPGTKDFGTNDLEITLIQKDNGSMEIGLVEFSDLQEIISIPTHK